MRLDKVRRAAEADHCEVTRAPLKTHKSTSGKTPGPNTHIHTHRHANTPASFSPMCGQRSLYRASTSSIIHLLL